VPRIVNPANEGQRKQDNACEHNDKEQRGKEVDGETYIHRLAPPWCARNAPAAEDRVPADVMAGDAAYHADGCRCREAGILCGAASSISPPEARARKVHTSDDLSPVL
jgi:hypothetical protein